MEIAHGLFEGRKQSAIAASLGISFDTVHTYLRRLYRKLGVGNQTELQVRLVSEFLALPASPDNPLPPICAHRAAGLCPLDGSPPGSGMSPG